MRSEVFEMLGCAVESEAQSLSNSDWKARLVSPAVNFHLSGSPDNGMLRCQISTKQEILQEESQLSYSFPTGDLYTKGIMETEELLLSTLGAHR